MAENETTGAPSGDGLDPAANLQFALKRIFLKDLSFELPMGAQAFTRQWAPQVNQDIGTEVKKVDEEHYEVVLRLTITVSEGEDTAYLIEVQQAGIFMAKGLEQAQLAQLLNTQCPAILFPYARELVDSLSVRGSFPALMLPPVNFDALFQQAVAEQRKNAAETQSASKLN
ncbi:protein-export chaperone SecB [Gammaproteobacteria bacterium 53_120_T64]|mgnify:CR=1 FL=1|nr:protein-export chaperone SecB [Gammaproteobacteria bacterium 53_120_T64]